MGEAAFFTEAARRSVTAAVVAIEAMTAAEVVVVVRRSSARWREVDLAVGAAAAFAVLLLTLFHPKPIPIVAIPVDVALGFAAGAVLAYGIAPFKRALLPRARLAAQVTAMARAAFVEQGVSRTTGRTGLLVYVSTFERRVELVPDTGIDAARLSAAFDALRGSLDHGVELDAFLHALSALGPPLGEALPRSADDVNELPDAPVLA